MIHLVISVVDGSKWRTACDQHIPIYTANRADENNKVVWGLGAFIHYERSGAPMCEACSEVPEVQIELLKRVKL